jgi:transcriptional regulator with XRE-family HTH domain
MTQVQFAEKLRVSTSLICDVEKGRRAVSDNLRIKIAQTFGTGDDVVEAIKLARDSERLSL